MLCVYCFLLSPIESSHVALLQRTGFNLLLEFVEHLPREQGQGRRCIEKAGGCVLLPRLGDLSLCSLQALNSKLQG